MSLTHFGQLERLPESWLSASSSSGAFNEAKLRQELEPDTDSNSFFLKGSEVRKVYSFRPDPASLPVLSKSQKRKQRKLARSKTHFQEEELRIDSSAGAPRRYIVDSGASFHLVDPRTLTKKEQETIEDIEVPIPLETANGEVVVTQRCCVLVVELNLYMSDHPINRCLWHSSSGHA